MSGTDAGTSRPSGVSADGILRIFKSNKRRTEGISTITPCLIAGDFLAMASARILVSFPAITVRTIARSAAVPVTPSTLIFTISMMMSVFTAVVVAAVALPVALVIG